MKYLEAIGYLAQITLNSDDIDVPKPTNVNFENILSLVFGIAGAIAVLVIVIAGLQYVVSRGDPSGTAKAKNAIIYAVIGLAVCISAFAIVNFVATRV